MAKVRLLSLNDLHNYFASTNKTSHFSSKDAEQNIVVQVNGQLKFDEANNKDIEGLLPVTLLSCHIDENINHSSIAEDVMIKAMPSFSNRPILGFIHEVDGKPQFYTHNMHLDENDELVYDEIPIGTVPESCNARLEEYDDKKYCVVDGYIYEGYTKAAEILRREQKCDVSVELEIRELSYNAKTDILNIEDFFFSGVTILGVNEEGNKVYPGMEGANITLADFSQKNNSVFSDNSKIIELLSEMNKKLDGFNINNSTRKEEPKTVFEKLLKKYNKTEADITFEHEGLSDEELEALFEEHFASKKKKKSSGDDDSAVVSEGEGDSSGENQGQDDNNTGETNTNAGDNTGDTNTNTGDTNTGDNNGGENTNENQNENNSTENQNDNPDNNAENPEVNTENPENNGEDNNGGENGGENSEVYSKTFELSYEDIRCGLYALLEPYEVEDNEWYWITAVYDDHFIYEGWSEDKIFDQKYSKDGDNVKFEGERVHLNKEYLTDSELVALNEMRSNYSLIQSKLESYEAEPQKLEILSRECYSQISETEAFKDLMKQESHFDMTVEDVEKKADAMLLEFAKTNKIEFSSKEDTESTKKVGMKVLPVNTKSKSGRSRYGGLFAKKN